MTIEKINFLPRIDLSHHPRYGEFSQLIGKRDFSAYREVFERGWAETSILCGQKVRLEEVAITQEGPPSSLLINLLGVNEHGPRRVRLTREFFDDYERLGEVPFIKQRAFQTSYVLDLQGTVEGRRSGLRGLRKLLARRNQQQEVRTKIDRFLNIYENMKKFGTVVGQAWEIHSNPPPLTPSDLPWAIDYLGYLKLRDGAHRRAAANYLGWESIPTLVFEFDQVNERELELAHPYIRDNFNWFDRLVRGAARMDAEKTAKNI